MFAKPTGRRRGVKEHVAVDINKLKEALDKIMTETKVHMPV
jgi:hypothetical protein